VSKKFRMLDVVTSSQARVAGIVTTHTARVPAFNNLGDESSSDVHEAPSPGATMEKPASPPPSASGEFLRFSFVILTVDLDDFLCRPYPACAFAGFSTGELRERPGALSSSRKFCFCLHIFLCFLLYIYICVCAFFCRGSD
jgi:hypothetical protein